MGLIIFFLIIFCFGLILITYSYDVNEMVLLFNKNKPAKKVKEKTIVEKKLEEVTTSSNPSLKPERIDDTLNLDDLFKTISFEAIKDSKEFNFDLRGRNKK